MKEYDDNEWLSEHRKPYTAAQNAVSRVSCESISTPAAVEALISAENHFWSFICEYRMQEDSVGHVFNRYLEQTAKLRRLQSGDSTMAIIQCLGLATLLLSKMKEVYESPDYGLTWTLDHPQKQRARVLDGAV